MSDIDRWEFLVALSKSGIVLNEFERGFVKSRIEWGRAKFTVRQKAVIDKMIDKYRARVDW